MGRAKPRRRSRSTSTAKQRVPDRIQPQLATLVDATPDSDDWWHEVKFDGYRLLARLDGGGARLFTRGGHDWTGRFPRLAERLSRVEVRSAWLDGEVVAWSETGASDFGLLQHLLSERNEAPLRYMVFDLPWCDGQSLAQAPLEERKALLANVLPAPASQDLVQISDHLQGRGELFFQQACQHGLEGIVSKHRHSLYRPGRSSRWLKRKCSRRQEFVVGGFTESQGRGRAFGALLLGLYEHGALRYVGRVGTGFSQRNAEPIRSALRALAWSQPPFSTPVPVAPKEVVHWVRPVLVVEVRFSNWTADGVLRHASFLGVRQDKDAGQVQLERAEPVSLKPSAPASVAAPSIKLSNPDKVLFSDAGITKQALAAYYEQVAEPMLRLLRDRPLTLLRCPDGEHRDCFFQKHIDPESMSSVQTAADPKDGSWFPVAVSVEGLTALVQLGTLEIHYWGARVDRLDRPDWITFDLDPGPEVPWHVTVQAAQLLRTLLEGLGTTPFLKLTGGKGLHLVVPILRRHGWDEVKAFAKAVAQQLVRFDPDTFSIRLGKSTRSARIFIDYLRNGRGATAVAPYSTRARPGAPVALPVGWELLDAELRPDAFTLQDQDAIRVQIEADPWRALPSSAVALRAAMWASLDA